MIEPSIVGGDGSLIIGAVGTIRPGSASGTFDFYNAAGTKVASVNATTGITSLATSTNPAFTMTEGARFYLDGGGTKFFSVSGSLLTFTNMSLAWAGNTQITGTTGLFITSASTNGNYVLGMNTSGSLTSGQFLKFWINNVLKFSQDISGRMDFDVTDSSGTPGAATINKPSGQVSIAAGASSVVVTNSLVSATSIVQPVLQFADATLTFIKTCVPGAGSFTITGNANATANTKVGFTVFNA